MTDHTRADLDRIIDHGAVTLLAVMPTTAWGAAAIELVGLFAGADPVRRQAEEAAWAEPRRDLLRAGPDTSTAQLALGEVRALVKSRLRTRPETVAPFVTLVERFATDLAASAPPGTVTQTATASDHATVYQAGGNITHIGENRR